MSLVDVDSWPREYEACAKLNQVILGQLAQREKRQRLSPEFNRLTDGIQVQLKQFGAELRQLKSKLDASSRSRTITFEETESRQQQVDTLQSQFAQLQRKFSSSARSERAELLAQPPGFDDELRLPGAGDAGTAAVIDTSDVNALKRRQIDILEDQNRGLEVLSETLSRQRSLATQLGQEVEDQNDILDNLANTMERVDTRVSVETGNIGDVNRRDSTWTYWIVIVVLFIAIIVVGVV